MIISEPMAFTAVLSIELGTMAKRKGGVILQSKQQEKMNYIMPPNE